MSTIVDAIPFFARNKAVAAPAGPAPEIKISVACLIENYEVVNIRYRFELRELQLIKTLCYFRLL